MWTSAFVSVKNRENSNLLLLGQLFITWENSSVLRSASHSVFCLKPHTLNYILLSLDVEADVEKLHILYVTAYERAAALK